MNAPTAMSKNSKPADRWQQVFAAGHDRPDTWCRGCGYYLAAHGVHRADCTAVGATGEDMSHDLHDGQR
jgi:hypothetical protein